jgi:hypothetical protein
MPKSQQDDPSELRVLTSSRDLDDYDILATMTLSVAVPHKTTESFRKMIWAAMATYGFGNSSVDHVMKRYGYLWDRRENKGFQRDPKTIALRSIASLVDEIAGELAHIAPSVGLGSICAKAALCRLEASFKAAYGLVRKEYIFETDAVVRLILEQLAWAYVVYSTPDNEVFNLSPTKCITRLKTVYPDSGSLYGMLSKWAHIDPSIAENYVEFHNAGVEVVRRSDVNSFESGAHIVALAPVYLKVVYDLFSPFSGERYEYLMNQLEHAKVMYGDLK